MQVPEGALPGAELQCAVSVKGSGGGGGGDGGGGGSSVGVGGGGPSLADDTPSPLLLQPGSAAPSSKTSSGCGGLAPQYEFAPPLEFGPGSPTYGASFPEPPLPPSNGMAQTEQLAHDRGAAQAGTDILTAQWADADDEVDLGDLFLGISTDEPGAV